MATISIANSHLAKPVESEDGDEDGKKKRSPDYLYHLGLHNGLDLEEMFGDTRFVCMGGSAERAGRFAHMMLPYLAVELPTGHTLTPIGKTERFTLYKIGPVISVSHGMGMPSMSILLHEITKLLHYAGARDVTYIRIGTSGGLGVPPGTVVVATGAVNGVLEAYHELSVLGVKRSLPAILDAGLAAEVLAHRGDIPAKLGVTMGTHCFYEGQGRLDGALCEYGEEEKMAFLRRAHAEAGVRNIEMEAPYFAAFTHRLGIKSILMCAALLDRLEGDQVTSTPEDLARFSHNASELAARYIQNKLKIVPVLSEEFSNFDWSCFDGFPPECTKCGGVDACLCKLIEAGAT
jgi:uridine phosphorylase